MTSAAPTLAPGSRIHDLVVEEVLDQGAYGVLYLATDPAIGTRFAVKEFFPPPLSRSTEDGAVHALDEASRPAFEAGLEQFRAEARLLGALDHPGIVPVQRLVEDHGTACMVMPYVRGRSLRQALESAGSLPPGRIRRLFLSLTDTLDYLHGKHVLHLDIKPANVYLTDGDRPLLLDFGAAAAHAGAIDGAPSRLGSPGYAAPEQSDPEAPIGPWTDIYGLAATLCRCVTGRVPPAAQARLEALDADQPDPLDGEFDKTDTSGLEGLTAAIRDGLALDPRQRPRSASSWRKAFEGLDWRQRVAREEAREAFPREGREWLPLSLLAVFVAIMAGIGIYLLSDPEPVLTPPGVAPVATAPPVIVNPRPLLPEETERWEAALEADTVIGYRRFIEDFPESVHVGQAQIQIDILDDRAWDRLSAEDTREAYQDYLEMFPVGRHQAEALRRIEAIDEAEARAERERADRERRDDAAWEAARGAGTVAALDSYIESWPGGRHIEEARGQRRRLAEIANEAKAWRSARELDETESYQAYLDAFPRGEHVSEALERMAVLAPRPGRRFRDCPVCPEMMVVPPGTFRQGSDDSSPLALNLEKPARTVTIPGPLAVGMYEVTLDEWDACVKAGGCANRPSDNGWGRGTRPAIMVSWNDAQQYTAWLSAETGQDYRLPSESEWEYFARGGEESDWLGGGRQGVCDYANIAGAETSFDWQHPDCEDGHALGTVPAGSFQANRFGLHDVIGNVAEWTADCLNLSYLDAPTDGSAWGRGICSSHMTRGGSWLTGTRDIRLPARFNLNNGDRNDFTGLRVVREVEQ